MTELRDKWDNKRSYWYARGLFAQYKGADLPKEERDRFPEDLLFIDIWYNHFRGKPYPTRTYYIPWAWPAYSWAGTGLGDVKRLCEITEGLRCETRPAVESDFFLFCPEEIDGDVLVITNEACYPPDDLNLIFGNVRVSKEYSETGYMKFSW